MHLKMVFTIQYHIWDDTSRVFSKYQQCSIIKLTPKNSIRLCYLHYSRAIMGLLMYRNLCTFILYKTLNFISSRIDIPILNCPKDDVNSLIINISVLQSLRNIRFARKKTESLKLCVCICYSYNMYSILGHENQMPFNVSFNAGM